MIFKHLFRSKHLSPDPHVRIQAINNLDNQDSQHKTILRELAFNDEDTGVSLAALYKLDSFVLWYKMSEIAKNERVQKKSQQYVEQTLLDEQNQQLSDKEKRQFIVECRDNSLLEKIIAQPWIQTDTALTLALLTKINKAKIQEKLLFDSQNENLQLAIINQLEDNPSQRKLINKLLKKSDSDEVKTQVSLLLDSWLQAEKIPVEVEQQVTMLLSRLLALKDNQDFLQLEYQQKALLDQYQQLASKFIYLSVVKKTEVEQKFTQISARVAHAIALLEPNFKAQQADLALAKSINSLVSEIEQHLQHVSLQLNTRISEIELGEAETLSQKISQHTELLLQLVSQLPSSNHSAHRRLEQLNNSMLSSLNTLASLPEFQNCIRLTGELTEEFKALSLPNDSSQIEAAEEYLRELKQQWRDVLGPYQSQFPRQLTEQWNKQLTLWQLAIKGLKTQINDDVIRCRNKIRAVESLVTQGKFKLAMSLYQKVQKWFIALPDKEQLKIQRSFYGVKEQIENLQDWQEYIATPRKPAILSEMEKLVRQPLSIDLQAKAIKVMRNQWNSLGKSDTESDQALNDAFELAIEQAFIPCREFYDQQQQEREQNMASKQQVLAEIGIINQSDAGSTELAKNLRNIQQKWKSIGEVDFKLRNELYDKYQQLLAPLRTKITDFYSGNAEQKQKLLTKAQQLLDLEPVEEAIEQAKKLQENWKGIEHAGKNAEAELWPAFRKANDLLFAKRTAASQQEKSELKEQLANAAANLLEVEQFIGKASDKAALQSATQLTQQLVLQINQLPANDRRTLEFKVQRLQEHQQQKLTSLAAEHKSQQYINLFVTLKGWQDSSELPEGVKDLSKQWQQSFQTNTVKMDRHELTIKMEIVAQQGSPKKDTAKRQELQMQLMAQKLQTGESLDLHALLKDWIKAGPLNQKDQTFLARIEPLFMGQ
jgi:exonuclease SbcC